jgi:hypothetical protein
MVEIGHRPEGTHAGFPSRCRATLAELVRRAERAMRLYSLAAAKPLRGWSSHGDADGGRSKGHPGQGARFRAEIRNGRPRRGAKPGFLYGEDGLPR